MLTEIKKFFDSFIDTANTGPSENHEHRLHVAAAALLIEVTRADHVIQADELEAVKGALKDLFGLPETEIASLVELANNEAEDSSSHYQFTSLINQGFDAGSKVALIEMLWRVVFADDDMDKYEEATVRKIADLLYVSHTDFIAAKQRARHRQ